MACAWAGFAGYATAMLLSYFVGRKKYPIPYPLRQIFVYTAIAAAFTAIMLLLPHSLPKAVRIAANTILLALFVAHIIYHDFPLSGLPVVGKYFKRQ